MKRVSVGCIDCAKPVSTLKGLDSLFDGFQARDPFQEIDRSCVLSRSSVAQKLVLMDLHLTISVLFEIM